jgi:membrane protease YdiL (CAAX protease family)
MGFEAARPVPGVEQLGRERECGGGLADAFGPDQQQRVGELFIDPARHKALENGAVADHRIQRGHGTDCAELPAVTQSQTPAQAAVPPHQAETGRHYAARVILYMEAAFLVLISFGFFSGAEGSDLLTVAGGGGLCIVGVVILGVGATRMRHDVLAIRDPADPDAKVPWDWTDFVMFWPGWFSAFQLLGSVAVLLTNVISTNSDPTVRNAIESSVLAVCQYGGMLFNIFVLGFMRRGGTLHDLGWRGFKWWWLPIAPVATYVALVGAGYLQTINQNLFPGVSNGQCQQVQHDYSHYYALAIIVVCVIAPISEETIFRGFIYGWLHRWGPAVLAIPLSAVIFSAVHQQLVLFLPLFFVGVVLASLYQGSRSIIPGILTHALFNLPNIIAILSTTTTC